MAQNEFAPVTPGEMLKDEFLVEYGLSAEPAARRPSGFRQSGTPRSSTIGGASPHYTALRLVCYFGNEPVSSG